MPGGASSSPCPRVGRLTITVATTARAASHTARAAVRRVKTVVKGYLLAWSKSGPGDRNLRDRGVAGAKVPPPQGCTCGGGGWW